MLRTPGWKLMLTVLAACLLAAGSALALEKPEINVEAGLFKPETVQKANDLIKALKQQHGKDLYVESFKSVPEGKVSDVKSMSPRRLARFFQDWAQEQATRRGVDGVYVLLCKQPPYAQVYVSEDLQERGLTDGKRAALARLYPTSWSSWSAKSRDEKLLNALEKTRREMVLALQGQPTPPATPTPVWLTVAYFAGALLVCVLVAVVGYWIYQVIAGPDRNRSLAQPATPVATAPGIDELKRRAGEITARSVPLTRPEDRTLTHHPAHGEVDRDT